MIKNYEWVGVAATIGRVLMAENIPVSKREGFFGAVVTPFQLSIQLTGQGVLYVDPERLTSPEERHRVVFLRYNATTNRWDEFPFTMEDGRWRLAVTRAGIYAMAINRLKESLYTEEAVSGFPSWYAARSDRNSNMRQFANVAAGLLFDVKASVDEIQRRAMLSELPETMPSSTVRYPLTEIDALEEVVVKAERNGIYESIPQAESTGLFLYDKTGGTWLLDKGRAVIHLMDGPAEILVEGMLDGKPFSKVLKGERKDFFNDFDEIGLQFGLTRIKNESNKRYRQRIMTLFSHPGNATMLGVKREIARRAGEFRTVVWADDRVGLLVGNITGRRYATDDVTVDGEKVDVSVQADGGFLIRPTGLGVRRTVVYYTEPGAYLLGKERATEVGTMSETDAVSYATWKEEAPVLYGGVRYDRQEWDMVNDEALVEWMPRTDSDMGRWD